MLKFTPFCNMKALGKINVFKNCSSGIWSWRFSYYFLKVLDFSKLISLKNFIIKNVYFGNGLRGLRVSQKHNNFEKVKKHDWCYQLVFEFQNKCPSFLFLIGLPPWCPISLQNFMNILRTNPEKQNCRNFADKNTLFWSQWTLIFSKTQFCQIFTVVMILTTCKVSVKLLKWILRKAADTYTGFSFIFATSNR